MYITLIGHYALQCRKNILLVPNFNKKLSFTALFFVYLCIYDDQLSTQKKWHGGRF